MTERPETDTGARQDERKPWVTPRLETARLEHTEAASTQPMLPDGIGTSMS